MSKHGSPSSVVKHSLEVRAFAETCGICLPTHTSEQPPSCVKLCSASIMLSPVWSSLHPARAVCPLIADGLHGRGFKIGEKTGVRFGRPTRPTTGWTRNLQETILHATENTLD